MRHGFVKLIERRRMRRIFILLFIISLFLNYPALSLDSKEIILKQKISFVQREFKGFFKGDFYNRIINYIQKERKKTKGPLKLQPLEITFLTIIDLLLSGLSLWLAILLLTGMKTLVVKRYLWFLFIFNISRFILLVFFLGVWDVLDFLVIRLRADLKSVLLDNFSMVVIITFVLIYIWLLARTFGLNFFGALGTFLSSHLIYFLIIFLFIILIGIPEQIRLFNLIKENIGINSIVGSYLLDIDKITNEPGILSLIRISPFHL